MGEATHRRFAWIAVLLLVLGSLESLWTITYAETFPLGWHVEHGQVNSWNGNLKTSEINHGALESELKVGYAIVTTKAIVNGSGELPKYVEYLKSKGFEVYLLTEDDYGYAEGQERAVNIRNWLKEHYKPLHITYVLLIGNPDPDDPSDPNDTYGDVPMIMAWPRVKYTDPRTNETHWYNSTPTDYFYADLTGNWDLDGDGYYGEYPDDFGKGGVDLSPEVFVGRIPVYDGNYTALDSILDRIMAFKGAPKKILLPMAVINYENEDNFPGYARTDGRKLPYYLGQLAEARNFSVTAMYEGEGLSPVPRDAAYYTYNISEENLIREWNRGYGIVMWLAHGYREVAYRKVWARDDGDGIPESSEMELYPLIDVSSASKLEPKNTFLFEASCLNGYPEDSHNLQYTLLKSAAIAIVGATRQSWYSIGMWELNAVPDDLSLGYVYVKNLMEGMTAGEALYMGKSSFSASDPKWIMNLFNFNLYGDPSLGLDGVGISKHGRNIIFVDDDKKDFPKADYTSISAALEYALPGETIVVYPGLYNETVRITKPKITLKAVFPAWTVINGSVYISSNLVTFEGFTIKGNLQVSDAKGVSVNDLLVKGSLGVGNSFKVLMSNIRAQPGWGAGTPLDITGSAKVTLIHVNLSAAGSDMPAMIFDSSEVEIADSQLELGEGLYLRYATIVRLKNVEVIGRTLDIKGERPLEYTTHLFQNVTLNGYPVVYVANSKGKRIEGIQVGQVIIANSTDVYVDSVNVTPGTTQVAFSDNVTISNSNLTGKSGGFVDIKDSVHVSIINSFTAGSLWIRGSRPEHFTTLKIDNVSTYDGGRILQIRNRQGETVKVDPAGGSVYQLIITNVTDSKIIGTVNVTDSIEMYGIGNSTVEWMGSSHSIYLRFSRGVLLTRLIGPELEVEDSTGITVTNSTIGNLDIHGNDHFSPEENLVEGCVIWYLRINTADPMVVRRNTISHLIISRSSKKVLVEKNVISPLSEWMAGYPGIRISGSVIIRSNVISGFREGIWFARWGNTPEPSIIYDNFFNNTENVFLQYDNGPVNFWNLTLKEGPNIVGGSLIGGNYWADSNGTGFSETCTDSNSDGICDSPYVIDGDNVDYLPLSTPGRLRIRLWDLFGHLKLELPNGSNVILNGFYLGKKGDFYLPPGRYRVNVTNPYYEDYNTTVVIQPGQTVTLSPEMKPLFGFLNVDSVPGGAEVYINGSFSGVTPLSRVLLSPGNYTIRIVKGGYEEYSSTVTVVRGQTKSLLAVLKPLPPAYLKVTSVPNGTSVYVDESLKGSTPLWLELTPGNHTIKLVRDGYQDYEANVTLVSGKVTEIKAVLIPKPAVLFVNSTPTGAAVYVDGEYAGETPLALELPSGNHTVELSKGGYANYTLHVSLSAGKEKNVSVKLDEIPPTTTIPVSTTSTTTSGNGTSPSSNGTSTKQNSSGGICGPAILLALALTPLLIRGKE
ncbi:hypothetical protein A3L09_06020 [Thermococcus profundus]|uniref:Uncharacterized protein n=1 Tax=Thermococcus profundus TaxID=49899 RepID=A0A2Z2MDZ3_THEPR|nr:PEGA domain-containing protein [Thermococcus profundus]ASJ02845.1 hypothetical protein A3L09_06020 [Thermococcus profundus]